MRISFAALTGVATITPSRQITVTWDTSDGIGSGVVALIVDNTKNNFDVEKCIAALVRSYHRQKSKASKPSGIDTSDTTRE